jgi:A/G-specific adenine glycosylase
MRAPPPRIARRLLAWYRRHGRKDLPWKQAVSAYPVWVSEIMLQQTQVATVVPYFQRFMARFPDVTTLAKAHEDEVLHLWSGLGYYSRARNLHAAARRICERRKGRLPDSLQDWLALPGVGRSTAGAVLALSKDQRHPILDGNVKRVLCRYHGIDTWPGEAATEKKLWALAERHTPKTRVAEYTQAVMDLGATLCTRSRPECEACPLRRDCRALAGGRAAALPVPKPRPPRPERSTRFLILRDLDHAVLLVRRPPSGVWGGLWGFPECAPDEDPESACRQRFGLAPASTRFLPPRRHGFSHFRLRIEPILMDVDPDAAARAGRVMEAGSALWYNSASPDRLGMAAPVRRILDDLPQPPLSRTA